MATGGSYVHTSMEEFFSKTFLKKKNSQNIDGFSLR